MQKEWSNIKCRSTGKEQYRSGQGPGKKVNCFLYPLSEWEYIKVPEDMKGLVDLAIDFSD